MKPGQKSPEERQTRYDTMAAYVRTNLLPYDFGLTADQEAELFAAVRSELEETNDDELFSEVLRFKVEEVADAKIRAFRDAVLLNDELHRLGTPEPD